MSLTFRSADGLVLLAVLGLVATGCGSEDDADGSGGSANATGIGGSAGASAGGSSGGNAGSSSGGSAGTSGSAGAGGAGVGGSSGGAGGLPPNGFVVTADFESLAVGDKAVGASGFDGLQISTAANQTYVHGTACHSGAKCARGDYTAGSAGGDVGGAWKLPKKVGVGDEVWSRIWVKHQTGFSWNCSGCSEGIKFMRTEVSNSDGKFVRAWDFYSSQSGMVVATAAVGVGKDFYNYYLNGGGSAADIRGIGPSLTAGTWDAYEFNLKLHTDPMKSHLRGWVNGVNLFDSSGQGNFATADNAGQYVARIKLFTYWNGANGVPKNQSVYVDDVKIVNANPGSVDAQGRPFIGLN